MKVFFSNIERTNLFLDRSDREIRYFVSDRLRELAPRLAADRVEYRHFGPYWWWIKPILRGMRQAKGQWFRGSWIDHATIGSSQLPYPDIRVAAEGICYYDFETVGDQPATFHIVELEEPAIYRGHDPDAGEQLDLFGTTTGSNRRLATLLADPTQFAASNWWRVADQFSDERQWVRAAAALRRAIEMAHSSDDRLNAWVRLGQLFQDHEHFPKALLCYQHAYSKGRETWVLGLMAELQLQANRPAEAASLYGQALKAMPGNPEYQAGLRRALSLVPPTNAIRTQDTLLHSLQGAG